MVLSAPFRGDLDGCVAGAGCIRGALSCGKGAGAAGDDQS
jgi:hypothetical protein